VTTPAKRSTKSARNFLVLSSPIFAVLVDEIGLEGNVSFAAE